MKVLFVLYLANLRNISIVNYTILLYSEREDFDKTVINNLWFESSEF